MLQLPEVVTAREGTILTWPGIPISWHGEADGSLGYKWAPPPNYAGMVRAGGDNTSYDWVREMSLEVRAVPEKNRVQLKLALTNTGNQPLHDVWSDGACLQHMTPEFIDADHSRTFLRADEGLVAMTDVGRSLRIRTRYVFDSSFFEEPFVKKFEWFWGRSPAQPVSGFVASRSTDGRRAVGIGWQDAFSIQQNSDRHHCMHSSPYFGTVFPGKTVFRYGVILFGDTVEALFAEFDRLEWRGHTARFQQ